MEKANIGAVLRDRIKERGYTQEDFAEKAGIGLSTLKKYISGNTAYNYEMLEVFSELLDCSADYLLGKSKSPKREFQDISNQLRLSDRAIEKLTNYAKEYDSNYNSKRHIVAIDTIITHDGMLESIANYLITSKYMQSLTDTLIKTIAMPLVNEEDNSLSSELMYIIDVVVELKNAKNSIRDELRQEIKKMEPENELEKLAMEIMKSQQEYKL